MKSDVILKINKIGKISSTITLICKIFVCIALVLALFGTIHFLHIYKTHPSNINALVVTSSNYSRLYSFNAEFIIRLQESLTSGSLSAGSDNKITYLDVAGVFFISMLSLTLTLITLFFVGSLCKAFQNCSSPFEENVIKKMQNFAVSLIPWTILTLVTNAVAVGLFSNKFNLNFTIDLDVVLLVLVVLVLVYIFKYGAILQQESDETL